jgi:hypothetical protein
MNEFKLDVTNGRPVKFKGESIAHDKEQTGTGRFTDLELYKTSGGNFVCERVEITQWQGESNKHYVKLVKTESEVIEFFGLNDQAKEIYKQAKIDISEEIE